MYNDFLNLIRDAAVAAALPVQHTGGPHPRPVLMTGIPLAPGHTSRCEYLDFVVCLPVTATDFGHRLAAKLPEGTRLLWQRRMPSGTLSLKAAIRRLRYTIAGNADRSRARAFEESRSWDLARIRKGRERIIDLKQSIAGLRVEPDRVILDINVREEGTPKPEEAYASIFGLDPSDAALLPTERSDAQLAPPPPFLRPPTGS